MPLSTSPSGYACLLAACLAALACTDGGPIPDAIDEELELDASEFDYLVQPGESPLPPEPAPEPLPAPEPDPEGEWEPQSYTHVVGEGRPQLRLSEHQRAGLCDFGVASSGLPAIEREAGLVVGLENENPIGPTDYPTTRVVLTWRDFDDQVVHREVLYDNEAMTEGWERAPRVTCKRLRHDLEQLLPELNAALDAEPLVPMTLVPVQLDHGMFGRPPLPERGAERPVELVYKAGELIARVRGMRVLDRDARPSWQGPRDSLDAFEPNILGVLGDRETGVVVVYRSYESASCMSDGQTYAGVARLSEAVFAEAELRAKLPLGPAEWLR